MQPTRPIKTFDKWFRHQVTLEYEDEDRHFIFEFLDEKGLVKDNDYRATCTMSGTPYVFLYFEDIYHANFTLKKLGGFYELHPKGEGVRKNEPLAGNFTMDDLKGLFGDPLPDKIEFLLHDLKHRGIDYFYDFLYMHQAWGRKWWPEAFIFAPTHTREDDHEQHCWLYQNVKEYKRHSCGIVEFGYINEAIMFKLAFGESPIPKF